MSKELSYPKGKIRIVLAEKIHPAAAERFCEAGYAVESIPRALQEDELREVLKDAHILGVRSRTKVLKEFVEGSKRLLSVGCFSVGTDQVDLAATSVRGIPVFNAPYSSTRSVAELSIANILSLARHLPEQSAKLHKGIWDKSAEGSYEVRGKKLGIIGYGHIGGQLGLLAEALSMDVYYYDTAAKLPLGRARAAGSMQELLKMADFVSLHVPGGKETELMIAQAELELMRQGSYLLNLSRGRVVDLEALADALKSGKLAGAALDVYPVEPAKNGEGFQSALLGLPNVILTPHVGGSTEEAQRNIGIEVADSLINFLDNGSTTGAVNFPQVQLPTHPGSHRILNVHKNVPGALGDINGVIAELGVNIEAQYLSTQGEVAYLIMDLNKKVSDKVRSKIAALPSSIRTRILF